MPERTILDFYRHDAEAPRSDHYVHHTPDGARSLSTEDFFSRTAALAEALSEIGISSGDRVMILSDNRPEWHVTDLAVLDLGAADVPVYGTLTPEQIAYQANDSGAVAAVVDTPEQMAKFLQIKDKCTNLRHLIQIEGAREPGVASFDAVIGSGRIEGAGERFWDRAAKIDPMNLMTIIYTSGTTGQPKGVMLSHDNLVQNVLHSAHRIPVVRDDLALEFLPLCHVLERMVGYIYMWRSTYKAYCSVHHVGELIAEIRPTLFVGVPRFFEKVQQKIMDKVASASTFRRGLFDWAMAVGRETAHQRLRGAAVTGGLATRFRLADRIVLSKIRQAFGGRLRFCLSGGAELPLFVNEFFHALNIYLVEGYGLTETSPVITVNGAEPDTIRLGTVGKPLDNLAIKVAEDGELLVKGPNVMQGYWNKPEQTAEVFDVDAWFHTGDIAEIDDDGFVLIIDRKKDLIVTAGGKNVAPQPIESQLKRSPYVDVAVLVGDRKPFIVALVSPAFDELERWASDNGIDYKDRDDLVAHPEVKQLFATAISACNASLARFEQVKDFAVLPITLTTEQGHLTPTLKVKRRVIEQQFSHAIDQLYSGS